MPHTLRTTYTLLHEVMPHTFVTHCYTVYVCVCFINVMSNVVMCFSLYQSDVVRFFLFFKSHLASAGLAAP